MEKTSPSKQESSPLKRGGHFVLAVLQWFGWWVLYTFGFVLIGAVAGVILFVVVGAFTHPELELSYRASKGVLDGAMYFGVWAGGLGIVLCARRAHKQGYFS